MAPVPMVFALIVGSFQLAFLKQNHVFNSQGCVHITGDWHLKAATLHRKSAQGHLASPRSVSPLPFQMKCGQKANVSVSR